MLARGLPGVQYVNNITDFPKALGNSAAGVVRKRLRAPLELRLCLASFRGMIASMSAGFTAALSKLELVDRDDPITMAVAKLIIELAKEGERDPARLCRGGYLTAPWNLSLADVLPKWSPHCMPPP